MVETVLVLIQVVSLVRLPGLALRIECPKTREAVVARRKERKRGGGVLVHPFHLIIDLVVAFLAFPFFFFGLPLSFRSLSSGEAQHGCKGYIDICISKKEYTGVCISYPVAHWLPWSWGS